MIMVIMHGDTYSPLLHFRAVLIQYKDKFILLSVRGEFSDAVENGYVTFSEGLLAPTVRWVA